MAVRIITDSASDISLEKASRWGVTVLPLLVRFGNDEYLDGVTLSGNEFYEKLEAYPELPKTSSVPMYSFMKAFEEVKKAGDEAVCICISAGFSGTYNNACMAKGDFKHIHVFDSRQASLSEYIIVKRAVELRDEGLSAQEIINVLTEEKAKIKIYAMLDTLDYLVKGGRLSKTAGFAGNLLSVKPILTLYKGEIDIFEKAHGFKKGSSVMTKKTVDIGGIDLNKPFCFGYSGTSGEGSEILIKQIKEIYGEDIEVDLIQVGPLIGTYTGHGAIGLAFFSK